MHNDRMDDGIRSKLKYYPTEINTDNLWENIQAKRKKPQLLQKKKKQRVFLLLLLLPMIIGYVKFSKTSNGIINQTSVSELKEINEVKATEKIATYKKYLNPGLPQLTEQIPASNISTSAVRTSSANSTLPNQVKKQKDNSNIYASKNKEEKKFTTILEKPGNAPTLLPPGSFHLISKNHHEINSTTAINPVGSNITSKKINTGASLYFSPEYAFKKLSSDQATYIAQRKASEKIVESWSVGFLYHVYLKNGLNFSTGINYQKTTEQLYWEQSQLALIKRDDQFFQQKTTRKKSHFNTLEHIDIPVFFGFQQQNNRFIYGIQTGVLFNLSQKAKGELLSTDLEPGQFIQMDQTIFKNRIAPSFAANLKIGFHLSPDVNISLSPGFKIQSNSITHPSFGVEQQYVFLNCGLGINWHIR